jgi:pimeloyl-ACP methyl ester carboxylesterase
MAVLDRRRFLVLSGIAAALTACGGATDVTGRTFVLVHGALHGGWCWRRVARLLRKAGAEVYTPTLTGLGERVHLNGPHIGLGTHVADVVKLVEAEELTNIVLVGHSYAGMVITVAAQVLYERIGQLVYLDAVIPRDGESALDAMGGLAIDPETKMFGSTPGTDFDVSDTKDRAWVERRITSQSAKTMRDRIHIKRDLSKLKRTYIACTADSGSGSPTDKMRQFALKRLDKTWRREEIATGHSAMITAPNELAETLQRIAAG